MANIAEQLIGQAMETAGTTPDMTAGINQGAQLAQNIEQMQMKRQQLEMQKQEHEMQKIDKLTSAMEAGAKMKSKSARNAYFKNYIPQMQKALGLTEFIPPETMEMIKADPEEAKKFSLLKAKIMNGDITFDEAVAQMQPEEWAAMDEAEVQQLEASEKFRVQQAGATARASAPNERLSEQFDVRQMSAVKDKFDQNTRKDFERYTAANNALALMNTNQPISDEAVKTQLARLAGEVGNLTEADLARFGGSRDLVERGRQLGTTLSTGKLTAANKKQLITIAQEFKKIVESKIRAQAERSVEGASALNLNKNKVKKLIDVDTLLEGGNVQAAGQDKKIAEYAKQYNIPYDRAAGILMKRGYKPGGK